MKKFVCDICGYIYDEEAGEHSEGIAAGTSFENLGSDWRCPVCDSEKKHFIPLEQNEKATDFSFEGGLNGQ